MAGGGDGPGTQDARALYHFGYACIEHGVGYLAIRPLARALELAPDAAPVLSELVTALEQDGQHARAVAVLEEHEPVMGWQHRFQYVYNALMAGSLDKAADGLRAAARTGGHQRGARRGRKSRRMLARAGIARAVTPLDHQDLRGWHYVLTGGVLASLSPYGFDAGMTGRWAYVSDSAGSCAAALARLAADPRRRRHRPAVRGAAARPVQPDPRRRGRRDARPAGGRLRPGQPAAHSTRRRLRPDQRPTRTPSQPCASASPARSCSSGRRAGPIRPASPPTSAACSARPSSRRGPRSCAASTTAPSARARQMTARPRPSPPRSPHRA